MANQTITAHVTVINPSSSKLPESKGNAAPEAAEGGDFANILSAQIQGEAAPVDAKPVLAVVAQDDGKPLKNKEEKSDPVLLLAPDAQAVAPEAAAPVVSITLLQNVHVKVQVEASGCCGDHDKPAVSPVAVDKLVNDQTLKADPDTASGLEKAAKETADPAKIAAADKSLPFEGLRETKVELGNQNTVAAGHLAPANRIAQGNSNAAPVALPPIPVPVGHEGWENAFNQRVVWVATNSQQLAQLQLNPPNLGPIEVRISLNSDQANAIFTSPHAAVREAIEAALPRLRDMLADNGLSLGNVNVSSDSFQQQAQQQAHHGQGHGRGERQDPLQVLQNLVDAGVPGVGIVSSGVSTLVQGKNGLVDLFA